MKFKNKLLLLAAFVVTMGVGACSSPTAQIALKRAHLTSQQPHYVAAEQFKTIEFAPPPAPDSDAQKADLAITLDWQNKRTEADCAKAKLTAAADYDSFWGEKSPFSKPMPAEVKKFFERLTLDLDSAVNEMKGRYQRLRPFKAYPGVAKPCLKKSHGYSYPSGHSTFSRVFADVLADIVPERKTEFLAKADEIAQDRVIGGVHFASDIAAGKVFGDEFHAELLKSPEYLKDIETMKTLLVK